MIIQTKTTLGGKLPVWEYRIFNTPAGKERAPSLTVESFSGYYDELITHLEQRGCAAAKEGRIGETLSVIYILADEVRRPSRRGEAA